MKDKILHSTQKKEHIAPNLNENEIGRENFTEKDVRKEFEILEHKKFPIDNMRNLISNQGDPTPQEFPSPFQEPSIKPIPPEITPMPQPPVEPSPIEVPAPHVEPGEKPIPEEVPPKVPIEPLPKEVPPPPKEPGEKPIPDDVPPAPEPTPEKEPPEEVPPIEEPPTKEPVD